MKTFTKVVLGAGAALAAFFVGKKLLAKEVDLQSEQSQNLAVGGTFTVKPTSTLFQNVISDTPGVVTAVLTPEAKPSLVLRGVAPGKAKVLVYGTPDGGQQQMYVIDVGVSGYADDMLHGVPASAFN